MEIGRDGHQTLLGTKEEMYKRYPEGIEHHTISAYCPFYVAEGEGKGDLYLWSPNTLTWVKQ